MSKRIYENVFSMMMIILYTQVRYNHIITTVSPVQ